MSTQSYPLADISNAPSHGRLAAPLIAATQVAYVLFLCVGHFKGNPGLAWIPFDLTIAAATSVLALSLLTFFATGAKIRVEALWMLLFFAAMGLSGCWTDWTPYAIEKATRFYSLTFIAALFPAFILTEFEGVKRVVGLIVILGLVLSAGVPIQILNGGFTGGIAERTTGFATVTIILGWDVGLALVGLYAYTLRGGKWLWLGVFCVPLFLVILASGARGPLFCAVGVIAVLTLRFSLRSKYRVLLAFALIATAWIGVVEFSSLLPQGSLKRVNSLLQGQYDDSALERVHLGEAAVQAIENHPLGMGFGGFGRVYNFGSETDHVYPHNIILDIAVDNGLMVALLFAGLAMVALRRSYRAAISTPALQPLFAMFLFSVSNSLISGELNADRTLFALLGIALQTMPSSYSPHSDRF